MNSQRQITQLIKSMSGQANILTIPRIYIDITKSHRAALLLSQCIYWSDKTKDKSGWFYKSFSEWREELGMNQHAVETARNILEKLGLVKIELRRNNRTNKNYWRVDFDRLALMLFPDLAETANPDLAETANPDLAETANPDLAENDKSSITEINVTEITLPAQKARGNPALYSLARSMADVCHVNFEANKGRMMKEAKMLSAASPTPTPELIKANYNGDSRAFWKARDWRGMKGQFPTPAAIRETWGQWDVPEVKNERMTVAQRELQRLQNGETENDILGIFSNL